jgi:hypothetical protein
MINSITYYLLLGVLWDLILNWVANSTNSKNILTNKEKIINILIWPISLIIFTYHFIKTLNNED